MNRLPFLFLLPLLLTACPPPPIPCPPNCPPPATATPTNPPTLPTPRATATPPPAAATATPTQEPADEGQLTRGWEEYEIDLTGFVVPTPKRNPKAGQPNEPNEIQLDSFAAVTAAWVAPGPPVPGPNRYPKTPAFQLGLRGTDARPCLAKPCAGRMALEVRFSSNIAYDRTLTDESRMCGAGTRPSAWLPLGPGPKIRVTAEWGPGFFRVSTPVASWQTNQGADGPGFGWWIEGIPLKGLGWSYEQDWTLKAHGGTTRRINRKAVGVQPPLGACP